MPRAKAVFDEEQVKKEYEAGEPIKHIAERQGVSPDVIRRFLGKTPERSTNGKLTEDEKKQFRLEWADVTERILRHYETRGNAVEKA